MELWRYIGGSGKKRKRTLHLSGHWRYFDGFGARISSICVALRGNFVCVFARLVSPVCNGGNLNRGSRIQRDELFNANKPF